MRADDADEKRRSARRLAITFVLLLVIGTPAARPISSSLQPAMPRECAALGPASPPSPLRTLARRPVQQDLREADDLPALQLPGLRQPHLDLCEPREPRRAPHAPAHRAAALPPGARARGWPQVYIPTSFSYILPMVWAGRISKAERQIPQSVFITMGALDSIAGTMQLFATNFIASGSLLILLQQASIPLSMLISRLTLDARYTRAQYAGALVVVVGLVVILLPTFSGSDGSTCHALQCNLILWSSVLVLSCVPMCAAARRCRSPRAHSSDPARPRARPRH